MDDQLAELFSNIYTPDRVADIEAKSARLFHQDMSTQSKYLKTMPPDPKTEENIPSLNGFSGTKAYLQDMMARAEKQVYPAPKKLPCANVQAAKYWACENPGTMTCSACRLVSYCSKKCQTGHWQRHKSDCRDPIRSDDWRPSWIREGRPPSFITDETLQEEFSKMKTDDFSIGLALWGNTPAMDVINLADNENNVKKDFSLAFIASGDLRHVLRSLNGLPHNYSGSLNILLNDINLPTVCRNLVLLLILGNIPDEAVAADIALHFWYSAFMPANYRLQISIVVAKSLQQYSNDGMAIRLCAQSTLSLCLPKEMAEYLLHFISSDTPIGDIQDEYNRVRSAPSRRDYRDRMYAGLKPSHRAAFQSYRRFGIILPFGAMNAHFNCPNMSLFTLEGKWWQTDYADPLEGWDTGTIIATGKKFGSHPEDIYGCFYFFMSEQLQMFARRIRTTKTSFTLFCADARDLPEGIHKNIFSDVNVPSSVQFDRIAVSNILDANYVGIRDVLTSWAPLLAEGKGAAIVGYFMNWFIFQKDGRSAEAEGGVLKEAIRQVMEKNKYDPKNLVPIFKNFMDVQVMLIMVMSEVEAVYENSVPFSKFLKKQGLDAILRKTKLRLREKHSIVPHRTLAPLKGPANALPEFPDTDSWYNYTKLTSFTWSERFVEFERA